MSQKSKISQKSPVESEEFSWVSWVQASQIYNVYFSNESISFKINQGESVESEEPDESEESDESNESEKSDE